MPFVFQMQILRPKAQAGSGGRRYLCKLGAIYKENDHSKHKHVCGSERSSSCLRPRPNIYNKDKQAQVLTGAWGSLQPGSLLIADLLFARPSVNHLISLILILTTPYDTRLMYPILPTRKLRLRKGNLMA